MEKSKQIEEHYYLFNNFFKLFNAFSEYCEITGKYRIKNILNLLD